MPKRAEDAEATRGGKLPVEGEMEERYGSEELDSEAAKGLRVCEDEDGDGDKLVARGVGPRSRRLAAAEERFCPQGDWGGGLDNRG